MKPFNYLFVLFLAGLWTAAVNADQTGGMAERIAMQMQVPDRHSFDLPRDEARKPYETFRFLGLESGMTVMDVGAYAGYTTEMLAAAVGPEGKVYAHNTEQVYLNYAEGYYKRTMDERLAGNRLPNVVLHIAEYDDLGHEGEVDMAFLGNLIHDFKNRDGEESAVAFLKSIHRALKPGGVLGVVDHVGVAGRDNGKLHRIEPEHARELLHKAGFVIESESGLFANPGDDHSLMVYNEEIYRRTDRFLFKAVKPAQ
jgi:predicted methyltransferase